MPPNPVPKMTLDEYFEFDRASEGRFEYFDGMLFELSGVTREHAAIEINLSLSLTTKAREKGCEAFPASLRVKPPSLRTYRYPDFSLACGAPKFVTIGGLDCLENPTLIIEKYFPNLPKKSTAEESSPNTNRSRTSPNTC